MKRAAILLCLAAFVALLGPIAPGQIDAVSAATGAGSSGGGGAEADQAGQQQHVSYALTPVLSAAARAKRDRLTAQIDDCFRALEALGAAANTGGTDLDTVSVYLLVEEYQGMVSGLSGPEKRQIGGQLQTIAGLMPEIEAFLARYDQGQTNAADLRAMIATVESLSTQYRAIQWILYL
jgi:hypothetical protein